MSGISIRFDHLPFNCRLQFAFNAVPSPAQAEDAPRTLLPALPSGRLGLLPSTFNLNCMAISQGLRFLLAVWNMTIDQPCIQPSASPRGYPALGWFVVGMVQLAAPEEKAAELPLEPD